VLGHGLARGSGGRWQVRIEDLDPGRCRPEFVGGILDDLDWLGLRIDGEPLIQSARTALYEAALDRLKAMGLVYPCFCTRADIAASLTALHGDAGSAYPGTCRDLPDDQERRQTTPHSWRLDSRAALARAGLHGWREVDGARFEARVDDIGDAILARKDAPSSYHLACVVDDADSGVTTVVRGEDLRPSTPIQRLLQRLLDLPEPTYPHHPLLLPEAGRRLPKRALPPRLGASAAARVDGRALAAMLSARRLPLGFRLSDA